jgi:hypothetical protein
MISPVACLECGKPYRIDKLANCPSCGVINERLGRPIIQEQPKIPKLVKTSRMMDFDSHKSAAEVVKWADVAVTFLESVKYWFVGAFLIFAITPSKMSFWTRMQLQIVTIALAGASFLIFKISKIFIYKSKYEAEAYLEAERAKYSE